jgi:hypothetical protein
MTAIFENNKEWAGYTVRESAKGWIVEGWSRYQGKATDYKILLPYKESTYKKGTDLTLKHNDYLAIGDYIYHIAKSGAGRVLRKGHIAQ